MNQLQEDEIDLLKVFKIIWDGKWIISTFTTVVLILGSIFIYIKDDLYQSQISYYIDVMPPYQSKITTFTNFKKMFYSKDFFESWKKNVNKTTIKFEDFSTTKFVNGFVLTRDQNEQLAILNNKKDIGTIIVKSNQLQTLQDFFNYANFINEKMKIRNIIKTKDLIKTLNTEIDINDKNVDRIKLVKEILPLKNFISLMNNGSNIFKIEPPTLPLKVPPSSLLILAILAVLSVLIGVFIVIIRSAVTKKI